MRPGPAPAEPRAHAAFLWVKAALFSALALNCALYVARGTVNEALDAVAWLTLLVLFELETGRHIPAHGRAAAAVRGLRLAAAAVVVVAAVGFVRDANTLAAANAWLWLAVVVLLEVEVRRPQLVARRRARFTRIATVVYGALAALVLVWAWRGHWLDAWDALAWLAAFAVIELDVLRVRRT
jgi:hypothetical protein